MTTKAKLKADYIANLQNTYPYYAPGSRALELANLAVDRTLAGELNLQGDQWLRTLRDNGLSIYITRKALAELPAE